jgi:D-alanyl-D-alanine carboxypeptidase/D-alanyl-D-alanine-endopeptidase (penicillin-binding protein 4)
VTGPRARRRSGVLLVMVAVLVATGMYFGLGAGRQYLADRAFHPIAIPTATQPAPDGAAALAGAVAVPTTADTSASPASGNGASGPTAAGIRAAVSPKLAAAGLGKSVSAQVIDAATGAKLLDQRSNELVAPASTAKLLTAAAMLSVHKVTDRFTTKVVAGASSGTVVLIGGGDPTLSGAAVGQATEYPEAARVTDLTRQVKKQLAGIPVTQILVDDSLFTGADTAPGWASEDAPSSYASPITAAMVDAGRDSPDATVRSATPDLAAGQALASGWSDVAVEWGTAPAGAKVLATVKSAPVGTLIEQMLSESDNVIAEVLARQVALATKKPASFNGAVGAISATLAAIGIKVGAGMKDGSGLSAADRIPAGALGQVLLKAVDAKDSRLHPIVAGLSVAGWDGTLLEQGRFSGAASAAQGEVRAKTGSMTGVSALAGLATDAAGRMLVFAFVADQVPGGDPDSLAARIALDQAVAALAGCGCR